jgi:hypothetical protein
MNTRSGPRYAMSSLERFLRTRSKQRPSNQADTQVSQNTVCYTSWTCFWFPHLYRGTWLSSGHALIGAPCIPLSWPVRRRRVCFLTAWE